jgi:hypothetical protein
MVGTSNPHFQSIHHHRDINSILIWICVIECSCVNGEFVKCLWVASITLYFFHISELWYLNLDFSFFDFGGIHSFRCFSLHYFLVWTNEIKIGFTIVGLEDQLAFLAIDFEDIDTLINNFGMRPRGLTMHGVTLHRAWKTFDLSHAQNKWKKNLMWM